MAYQGERGCEIKFKLPKRKGNRAIPNMTISPKTILNAALIHIYSVSVIANN